MTHVMNEAAAMMVFTAAFVTNEQPIILEHPIMDFQPLAHILAHHQFFARSCRD
jgi:isochorismate hydrolase